MCEADAIVPAAPVGSAITADFRLECPSPPVTAAVVLAPVEIPLVVDLDGTLLCSDTLVEALSVALTKDPRAAVMAFAALRSGRTAFKQRVAEGAVLNFAELPWNEKLLDLIRVERERGRRIYLASAANRKLAEGAAAYLGLFDGVFSSDHTANLKGSTKAAALCAAFGEGGFVYAGDAAADFPVWQKAASVIVVNASHRLTHRVLTRWPAAQVIAGRNVTVGAYLRAIRIHQWLKNLLIAVPAIAGHQFGLTSITNCLLGFLSFSLCASSVYIMNDLLDLSRDRAHPTKRNRPFASGTLPIAHGLILVPLLLCAAVVLALGVRPKFLLVLGMYYGLTVAYSLFLKEQMMLDVVTLACLYGLRLVAGGVAADLSLSFWLGSFSAFLFTSLALIKRCTELIHRRQAGLGDPPGRDYHLTDLPTLQALASAAGFTAIVVFALYMRSGDVVLLYNHPNRLWLICVILTYWISRVLMLTNRGEMSDDPVVFAVTDRISLACGAACLAVIGASL